MRERLLGGTNDGSVLIVDVGAGRNHDMLASMPSTRVVDAWLCKTFLSSPAVPRLPITSASPFPFSFQSRTSGSRAMCSKCASRRDQCQSHHRQPRHPEWICTQAPTHRRAPGCRRNRLGGRLWVRSHWEAAWSASAGMPRTQRASTRTVYFWRWTHPQMCWAPSCRRRKNAGSPHRGHRRQMHQGRGTNCRNRRKQKFADAWSRRREFRRQTGAWRTVPRRILNVFKREGEESRQTVKSTYWGQRSWSVHGCLRRSYCWGMTGCKGEPCAEAAGCRASCSAPRILCCSRSECRRS